MIKVMIVDDHEIVRKGLVAYLNTIERIDVVGEASSGNEAIQIANELKPDVILMDLMMDDGSGIEATKAIVQDLPDCKIIILTSYYDHEQVFPALEAGAFSYLLKTSSADEIATAIQKAIEGEHVMAPQVTGQMMSGYRANQKKKHDLLTKREMEVLLCIGNGMSNEEISQKLYISVKTVKTHVSNILAKLEVKDRTQAAVYVHQHRLDRKM